MIFEMDEDFWSSWNALQAKNLYVYINTFTEYWSPFGVIIVVCCIYQFPLLMRVCKNYFLGFFFFTFIWNWENIETESCIGQ